MVDLVRDQSRQPVLKLGNSHAPVNLLVFYLNH